MNFDSFNRYTVLLDSATPLLLHSLGQHAANYHIIDFLTVELTIKLLCLLIDLLKIDHQPPLIQFASLTLRWIALIFYPNIA